MFHPKAYLVADNVSSPKSISSFVGSGNLTFSGLILGHECGVLSHWAAPSRPGGAKLRRELEMAQEWFEDLWQSADPLAAVLVQYKKARSKTKIPPPEDDGRKEKLFHGTSSHVVNGIQALSLESAVGFWAETGRLSRNLGRSRPGNQLDLQRGARVFFGFAPNDVSPNTVFGDVIFRCEGFPPSEKTVRFGNNSMDKVNLPIPETEGPDSYDNSIILFERLGVDYLGRPSFRVQLGTQNDLEGWKGSAAGGHDYAMQSGRRYGTLF